MNMSAFRFEWDDRKAAANEKKHGVGFEEGKSVFSMSAPSGAMIPIIPATKTALLFLA